MPVTPMIQAPTVHEQPADLQAPNRASIRWVQVDPASVQFVVGAAQQLVCIEDLDPASQARVYRENKRRLGLPSSAAASADDFV